MKNLPPRNKVNPSDTWDLSSLFSSDRAWEKAFSAWEKQIAGYSKFQGILAKSPATLAECCEFDEGFDRTGERLGTYAFLKAAEDTAESEYQRMQGRYMHAASLAAETASFIRPKSWPSPPPR